MPESVAAIVMAAGASRRMGQPKMLLPWEGTTVIGAIASKLLQAGIAPVLVVAGPRYEEIKAALHELPVNLVFNPRFDENSMLLSFQAGLAALADEIDAVLVVLGDQPQLQDEVVRSILEAFRQTRANLIVPSYCMRRGHPWLVGRPLWKKLMALSPEQTLRDFLNAHADQIFYLTVESDTVLQDLDTPDDYSRLHPK